MVLNKRGLNASWRVRGIEFTISGIELRPWPDSVEGIGMRKKNYVVRDALTMATWRC